jgi:hypothetical protein
VNDGLHERGALSADLFLSNILGVAIGAGLFVHYQCFFTVPAFVNSVVAVGHARQLRDADP